MSEFFILIEYINLEIQIEELREFYWFFDKFVAKETPTSFFSTLLSVIGKEEVHGDSKLSESFSE